VEDSLLQDVMAQLLEKHSDWKQRHGQTLALAGMLTYAHVCSRMLTYAHVCSRMQTLAVAALIKHAAAASRWAAAPAVAALAPQVSVFALLYQ
jgi:hypothetical protein